MKVLIRATGTNKSTWRLVTASTLTNGQNITLTDGTKLTVAMVLTIYPDNYPDAIPVDGTVA
jgi:hypothetical protein